MFAGRYFAERYFAPRYFPAGGDGEPVEPEVEETFTGGFPKAWGRSRDEEEVRRQRIALGIIPDDAPEPVRIAAREPTRREARRKLRQEARQTALDDARLTELEAMLDDILAAQRAAVEEAEIVYLEAELLRSQRNRNARAVLAMLGAIS